MSEGSLAAPTRHAIAWRDKEFYDQDKIQQELVRVFDICHGCRRCFNLCESFPILFDLIDESASGELDSVDVKDFKKVIDNCTLCDMCFMTKCPYVPPHQFDLDFPHLMLRARALQFRKGDVKKCHIQLTQTDRNGKLGVLLSSIVNWMSRRGNIPLRKIMQWFTGLNPKVALPLYAKRSLQSLYKRGVLSGVDGGEGSLDSSSRKVVIFGGCHCNYSDTEIGRAAFYVLEQFSIKPQFVYPECCGMPQMEVGNLSEVASKAERISAILRPYVDGGYDVVGLTPSCTLLMKFEWSLLLPENEDVIRLKESFYDISEYIVKLAREGDSLPVVVGDVGGTVSVHIACHSRAQNMGQKGAELLRLLPELDVNVVERCSGHGGAWGVMDDNFATAVKVGRPAMRSMLKSRSGGVVRYITSECPLAALHLEQMVVDGGVEVVPESLSHPVILLARAYGMS